MGRAAAAAAQERVEDWAESAACRRRRCLTFPLGDGLGKFVLGGGGGFHSTIAVINRSEEAARSKKKK
jgi:hypothetical protein